MITLTFYRRPDGQSEDIEFVNIEPEDEAWFKEVGAKLSGEEDTNGGFILYADVGIRVDGEVVEAIEITGTKEAKVAMHDLRVLAERMLENWKNGSL